MSSISIRAIRVAGAVLTVVAILGMITGCGDEKQNVTENTAPTAVPGGASKADYQQGMNKVLQQQQGK